MLSQAGIVFEERDYFKDRLTAEELRAILGGRAAAEIFSWRSPTARKLGLHNQQASLGDEELIRLMLEEPNLIRRPLITVGGEVVPGFDKVARARLSAILGKSV